MTRQLLFVQGGGEGVHDRWDDKLVASLRRELGSTYEVRYPCMPDEGHPKYAAWKRQLGEELAQLDDGPLLVAHSVGANILVHALAEAPPERAIAFSSRRPSSARAGGRATTSTRDRISRRGCPTDRRKRADRRDITGRDFLLDGGVTASYFFGELAPQRA